MNATKKHEPTKPEGSDAPPCSASDDYCAICHRMKQPPPEYPNDSVCCCNGLQPFAMSRYPGEFRLVESHPGNSVDQWYRRADVDALLASLSVPNDQGEAQPPAKKL